MDRLLISIWIKKMNSIMKICGEQKIQVFDIIPLHLEQFKGTALVCTKNDKYIVKWNDELSYLEYKFHKNFAKWFNQRNSLIIPSFLDISDELSVENGFYFLYHYIESSNRAEYSACARSISEFHRISRDYNNDYYHNLGLNSTKMWLDGLIDAGRCIVNNATFTNGMLFDIDLTECVSDLRNCLKKHYELYDDNYLRNNISICHGDMNLKNFIHCKDGSCRIIDLDTLSYSLRTRDLFCFLKSLCINNKEETVQCLIEYDKICTMDEIEYNLLSIMCNPALNLHYRRYNNYFKTDDDLWRDYIYGIYYVYNILSIIKGEC